MKYDIYIKKFSHDFLAIEELLFNPVDLSIELCMHACRFVQDWNFLIGYTIERCVDPVSFIRVNKHVFMYSKSLFAIISYII